MIDLPPLLSSVAPHDQPRTRAHSRRMRLGPHIVLLVGALACKGDAECIFYPCPLPIAAIISVSASNAPAGIAGLTVMVSGVVTGGGPCTQGLCHVFGGRGNYHVELQAPGYVPAALNLTITGEDAGCNTCGHIDTQAVSVTMQPTGA
jgi:hypothetical protein